MTTGGVSDGALNGFLATVIGGLVILGAWYEGRGTARRAGRVAPR